MKGLGMAAILPKPDGDDPVAAASSAFAGQCAASDDSQDDKERFR
jgi:hypothetical protein